MQKHIDAEAYIDAETAMRDGEMMMLWINGVMLVADDADAASDADVDGAAGDTDATVS